MKRFANTSTLLCLILLGACSTTPAPKPAPVVKTQTELLLPQAQLRQSCKKPTLVPSKSNRDIVDNSLERQSAFDACNIRHQCLIDWLAAAEKAYESKTWTVSTPKSCGSLIK